MSRTELINEVNNSSRPQHFINAGYHRLEKRMDDNEAIRFLIKNSKKGIKGFLGKQVVSNNAIEVPFVTESKKEFQGRRLFETIGASIFSESEKDKLRTTDKDFAEFLMLVRDGVSSTVLIKLLKQYDLPGVVDYLESGEPVVILSAKNYVGVQDPLFNIMVRLEAVKGREEQANLYAKLKDGVEEANKFHNKELRNDIVDLTVATNGSLKEALSEAMKLVTEEQPKAGLSLGELSEGIYEGENAYALGFTKARAPFVSAYANPLKLRQDGYKLSPYRPAVPLHGKYNPQIAEPRSKSNRVFLGEGNPIGRRNALSARERMELREEIKRLFNSY